MLERIGSFLQGKKTYIIVVLGVVLNGLASQGYIDASVIDKVNSFLMLLGLGTIRSGISKTP